MVASHGTVCKTLLLFIFCAAHAVCWDCSTLHAAINLAWNANSEQDLAGYRVYYGTSSRNYTNSITVGKQYTTCTLDQNNLTVGRTYYIALTAYDSSLNESVYSQEVSATLQASTTTTTTSASTTTTVLPSGSSSSIEAEDMSYHACGAQTGDYWNLWANGTMGEEIYFPASGTYRFEIVAKATLANSVGPEMELMIDGETMDSVFVHSTVPQTYIFTIEVSKGTHELAIGFYNDYCQPSAGIDRNLLVDRISIAAPRLTIYENAEDGLTAGWTIYDSMPAGATIENVYDGDKQSYVIELTGAGTKNGYRLNRADGNEWSNTTQRVIEWSMNYAETFIVYIDVETSAGHRDLVYRPAANGHWVLGEYVILGLGDDVIDGQWHTFVRDLQADLTMVLPGVTILEVNGFLIRGSGMVDDIKLRN